jgi:hypothetical protein
MSSSRSSARPLIERETTLETIGVQAGQWQHAAAVTLIASYRRHALRQGFGQTVMYSDHLAPAFAAPRRYQYRIEERR